MTAPHILFMCVANSARSQLAEALAKDVFGAAAHIESAGSRPSQVNPLAIQVLAELGIDGSKQFSKSTEDLDPRFLADLNYVITLCAEEVCPLILNPCEKRHWPFPDPASHHANEADAIRSFRTVRDGLREKLAAFRIEIT